MSIYSLLFTVTQPIITVYLLCQWGPLLLPILTRHTPTIPWKVLLIRQMLRARAVSLIMIPTHRLEDHPAYLLRFHLQVLPDQNLQVLHDHCNIKEPNTDVCIQLFDSKIHPFSQLTRLYLESLSVRVSILHRGLYGVLTICLESTSATDRRQQSLTFTLTPDQSAKLKVPG